MMDFNNNTRSRYVELHLNELRAQAAADRLARQARGPRPLRRRLGRLLMAAGASLVGQSLEALLAERAQAVADEYAYPTRAPA